MSLAGFRGCQHLPSPGYLPPDITPEIHPFVNRIIYRDAQYVPARIPDRGIDLIIAPLPYTFAHAFAQDTHDNLHDGSVEKRSSWSGGSANGCSGPRAV